MFHFEAEELFAVDNDEAKKNVKVSFDKQEIYDFGDGGKSHFF